jgi:general secretion pathway protein C
LYGESFIRKNLINQKEKMKRLPLIITIILFACLCALISFGAMRAFNPKPRMLSAPVTSTPFEPAMGQWGPVFGRDQAVQNAPSIFALKGVVYSSRVGESLALVVVDDKPGMAIAVGKEIIPNVKLMEVHPTYVVVSESGISRRIDMPPVTPGANTKSNFSPPLPVTEQPMQPMQTQQQPLPPPPPPPQQQAVQ